MEPVGGCGLLLGEDGEVETFLLSKTLDMDKSELEGLAERTGSLLQQQAEETCQFIIAYIAKLY